jgi:uncharacterized membrane protein
MAGSAVLWLLKGKINNALELARIEAAKKIIQGADKIRLGLRGLTLFVIMTGFISGGAVMLITGISMIAVMRIMYAANPSEYRTIYETFFWFPMGLCLGGLVSIIPPFIFIFFYILSEKTWMRIVKNNKLVGNFVSDVLDEAEKKTKQRF